MMELVSIITPCYNSEKYILDTINSVLNQSYENWEWIIVDDNSVDRSTELINSIQDVRIKLIKLQENKGAANARNAGIKLAKGRYLSFLDSDDIWLPSYLEKSIGFLKENNEVFVYSSYKRYDEDLKPYLPDFIAEDNIDYNRLLYNCPIFISTVVYDIQKVGKIEVPKVDLREDHAYWLKILKKIPRARAITEPLVIYRVRKGSVSRNKFKISYKQFLVYYDYLDMSLIKSLYYTFYWAINGIKKYGKL